MAELPWSEGAKVPQGAPLVKLASPDLQLRWGRAHARVVIHGSWEAPGLAWLHAALALVWREAGF